MITTCPDCESVMHSRVCACGFSLPSLVDKPVDAVSETRAAVDDKALADARKFCADNGLDTREKQWQFIKAKMAAGRMFTGVKAPRQPGEDTDHDVYGDAA